MVNTNLRIKELAKEKQVSITSIAEALGIGRVAMSQALSRNQFSIPRLAIIADVLGVTIPELFEASKPTELVCPKCGQPISIHLS